MIKQNVFGAVRNGTILLNERGVIVEHCWNDLVNHYRNVRLDEYVVMPDHFHGIVHIVSDGYPDGVDGYPVVNGFKPFTTIDPNPTTIDRNPATIDRNRQKNKHGLSEIIRGFKTFSSRRINELSSDMYFKWQKSFHDRIIRSDAELFRIRRYIKNNPRAYRGKM